MVRVVREYGWGEINDHLWTATHTVASGTLVDVRYRIFGPLGSGGMADVYLAFDERLDREVAIKVLKHQYVRNPDFVQRFEREARAAAALSHPHIVSIHDRGVANGGIYYIVMELLTGGTIRDRIEERGKVTLPTALGWAAQIARALDFAHRRGVIHRDVKPENVLLSSSGEAKVADFGIARVLSLPTLTGEGQVMGSLHYLAPERLAGMADDPRSDLYSLGVVMHEMLTGRLPERAAGVPVPSRELARQIPEPSAGIILRLLQKDPGQRYPDAASLVEDLESVRERLTRQVITPVPPPPVRTGAQEQVGFDRPRPRKRGWVVFAGVLSVTIFMLSLAGVTGLGLVQLNDARTEPEPRSDPSGEPEQPEPSPEVVAAVPDFSGDLFDPDDSRWTELDVTLRVRMARSSAPVGTILYTDPAAGTEVGPGDTLVVVISGSRSVVNPHG